MENLNATLAGLSHQADLPLGEAGPLSLTLYTSPHINALERDRIFAPLIGYDEPEILPSSLSRICLTGADAGHYQTFTKHEGARYGRAHPANMRLDGRWRHTSVMPTIYPTHMYVLAPDHLWYLSLRPDGVSRVHVRFGVALASEVHASLDDDGARLAEVVPFFDDINAEDRVVVEGIYRGVQAPLAAGGPMSWLEREVRDFAGYLARRLSRPVPRRRTGKSPYS